VCLEWTQATSIDLDASALLYAERTPSDVVFFDHPVSNDGSVRHTGESITVELEQVPVHITQIVLTVSSYTGQGFDGVESVRGRLVDEASGGRLASFELPGGGPHSGLILAKVYREPSGGWAVQAIGGLVRAGTFQRLLRAVEPHL
jgi:tellurium resistance protein TerZ